MIDFLKEYLDILENSMEPPIINSINVEGGIEKNQKLYAKYRPLIKWL